MTYLSGFFFDESNPLSNVESGVYQMPLVVLSYLMASFASYTALSTAQQLVGTTGRREKRLLHCGGAFAMGAGIWSMHFIGMLSYKMRMVISYDPFITFLSMFIAIAVAYGVLGIVAREKLTLQRLIVGAVLLGLGICGMHYTGMAAMKMDGDLRYTPGLFLLSVAIAVAASGAALWLAFNIARNASKYRDLFQYGAAMVMGAAICGMHYTGMAAAVFIPYADCRYDPNQNFDALALSIAGTASLILSIALAAGFHKRQQDDRRVQAEREKMALQLQDASRRKDQFIAMLAHELQNPLAPIRNAAILLQTSADDPKTIRKIQDILDRQTKHMIHLVDDLIDVSRITQGKITLKKERFDFAALIRQVMSDFRERFEAAGILPHSSLPSGPVWVNGDSARLTQVIENLLGNAIKFTDQGGTVTVTLEAGGGQAVLDVADTGVGIEPDVLPRLFEPFEQADRSLARSQGGLGLGLALVRGLVEQHGGQAQATSAGLNKGSKVTIRLPVIEGPGGEAAAPKQAQ